MNINTITAEDLRRMSDKEGLILQGCGGDLTEWVDGINEMLTHAGILKDGCQFENVFAFQHGELTCLPDSRFRRRKVIFAMRNFMRKARPATTICWMAG